MSSLGLSNDALEGKIVAENIRGLLERDKIHKDASYVILKALSALEEASDGLGFCLSEESDLLSQWRGYADDGYGFSIGLSTKSLKEAAEAIRDSGKDTFRIEKVIYAPEQQENALEPVYQEIIAMYKQGKLKMPPASPGLLGPTQNDLQSIQKEYANNVGSLVDIIFSLSSVLFLLKKAAFSEEHEWRLITPIFINLKMHGKEHWQKYRVLRDRIVPYRVISLKGLSSIPITDVIIGPKNLTETNYIEDFLHRNGFPDVRVQRSTASYR